MSSLLFIEALLLGIENARLFSQSSVIFVQLLHFGIALVRKLALLFLKLSHVGTERRFPAAMPFRDFMLG